MRSSIVRMAKQAAPPPRPGFRSRMPQSSYYKNNRPGAALERARRSYLVPNMITGGLVVGCAVSIYAYTINAISQDEFEDVPIPDGPAPAAHAPHASANTSGGRTVVGTK